MKCLEAFIFEDRKYVLESIYMCDYALLASGFAMVNQFNQLTVFFDGPAGRGYPHGGVLQIYKYLSVHLKLNTILMTHRYNEFMWEFSR